MTTRTLDELARLSGATVEGDGDLVVRGPASLEEAGPDQVSFLAEAVQRDRIARSAAAAFLVGPDVERGDETRPFLRCADPNRAFDDVVLAFSPDPGPPVPGVHASSTIDPTAVLGEELYVGPGCNVEAGVRLGARCVLHAGVHVGAGSVVGEGTQLFPGVVLYPGVELGARCSVHSGTVIGADGFGYDLVQGRWEKVPQRGTVWIGDDVEIGANTTVDRGRFGATRIGRGSKIDNLVHVAHNCQIGEDTLLIAQVGIAGSTRIGNHCVIAGKTGIGGHLVIGDGTQVAPGGRITKSLPPGSEYVHLYSRPRREAQKLHVYLGRLPRAFTRLKEVERRLAALEEAEA